MSTFLARAKRAVLSETKNKREYVAIDFETVDTPKRVYQWAGYFGDDYGKDNKSTTERTIEALRRCGWQGTDVNALDSVLGVDCDITIKTEEYNGQMQTKVAFINLPGEGGFKAKPLETARAKSFARGIAAQAANIKAAPRPAAPKAEGNGAPGGDEEIPF